MPAWCSASPCCSLCFALAPISFGSDVGDAGPDFCAYLILVAALSITGYVFGRCGVISAATVRYDMLSLLGAVGLGAWYLRIESLRWLSGLWVLLIVCWAASAGALAHARLWAEYLEDAPDGGKRRIINELDARGIRYAISYYANAYPIAFLSEERIIVASSNRVRIRLYQEQVQANRLEAVRITRSRCKGGERVMAGLLLLLCRMARHESTLNHRMCPNAVVDRNFRCDSCGR